MNPTQHCLRINFATENKELVIATLLKNDISSFQEGEFGVSATLETPKSDTLILCYFETLEELKTLEGVLRNTLPVDTKFSRSEIAQENWKESWKEFSQPIEISENLVIHSTWHEVECKPRQQAIVIDPEMAFGTGSHPTTKMCLQLIDSLYLDINTVPEQVLDVGCGSGVLSIAADLLGATSVVGIDIDPEAVIVSAANASRNKAWNCQFSETALDKVPGTFDLVLANILSGPLTSLWPEILAHAKPDAKIIISGLLAEEEVDFFDSLIISADEIIYENSWLAALISQN